MIMKREFALVTGYLEQQYIIYLIGITHRTEVDVSKRLAKGDRPNIGPARTGPTGPRPTPV